MINEDSIAILWGYVTVAPNRLKILTVLQNNVLNQSEIANQVGIARQTVSKTINHLVSKQLVEQTNPPNKRNCLYTITSLGRKVQSFNEDY